MVKIIEQFLIFFKELMTIFILLKLSFLDNASG